MTTKSKKKNRPTPVIKKRKSQRSWELDFIYLAYDAAREGLSDHKMCLRLGIAETTLRKWRKSHPTFKRAIEHARKINATGKTKNAFIDYVHKHIPYDLRDIWDEIMDMDLDDQNSTIRIERMFSRKGLRARQNLLIHAYVASNFNWAEAFTRVGISKRAFEDWKSDPYFKTLIDELIWYKKEFYEAALNNAVGRNELPAIMLVNQTFNKDRGFGKHVDVNVKNETTVNVNMNMDRLFELLDTDTKKKISQALIKLEEEEFSNKEQLLLGHNVIDAEIIEDDEEDGNEDED